MNPLEHRLFYRRHLPHFQPPEATVFITFRLAGSLPHEVLEQLLEEATRIDAMLEQLTEIERLRQADIERRRMFGKWDSAIDTNHTGPQWLRDRQIAALVAESLHYRNGRTYTLKAYCVMPNHVHLVCAPLSKPDGSYEALPALLHSLKGFTAHSANQYLGRSGEFWQKESYDHVIRDEAELQRVVTYIVNNPVKAGFVQRWEEWEWSYCRATC